MKHLFAPVIAFVVLIGLLSACNNSSAPASAPTPTKAAAAAPTAAATASTSKETPAAAAPVSGTPVALSASNAFGRNLIVNGDAEAAAGAANDTLVVPVPGWTTVSGKFTAVQYGAEGGFAEAKDPGPQTRGRNYFVGGPNAPESSATQTVDLSAIAAQIDGGKLQFKFEGYLGGYQGQTDNAVVTLTWLNATGASAGTVKLGPVTAEDRKNKTGLLLRTASGAVPAGTRSARITMVFTRVDGSYNDGAVDSLSLSLTQP